MEFQEIINSLDNTPNKPSKFQTKDWIGTNYDPRETYNTNSQIIFKTSKLKSSLCDYSNAYILVSGTITFVRRGADDASRATDRNNKQGIFKNCALFTDCITNTQVDNTQVGNAEDLSPPSYFKKN